MTTENLSDFLRHQTRRMATAKLASQSDPVLVQQALAGRDEAAFQAIIERHGPMVYRVCWRVLKHVQDAEDAFQATFLVLATKLGGLRKRTSLASWLHGIAHRVALKAKAQSGARQRCEEQSASLESRCPDDVSWGEVRAVLDAELNQLPEHWRLPLILCYLEGRTQDEAATHLGCSQRTVRRRLQEARDALGRRLRRRGIAWSATISAALLSDCVSSAAMTPALVCATVDAAGGVLAGKPLVSAGPKVSALTEGVIQTMFTSKLKAQALFLAATTLFMTAVFVTWKVAGQEQVTARQVPQSNVNSKVGVQVEAADANPARKDAFGDSLPDGALLRMGSVRFRHKGEVTSVAFSHDGKRLVTAGGDSALRFWDAATGKELASVADQQVYRASMVFSPNGELLVLADDEQISFRDGRSGKLLRNISNRSGAMIGPVAVGVPTTFSSDGQWLATGLLDGSIRIWNVHDDSVKLQLPAQKQTVRCLAFSRDGKVVLAATGGNRQGATIRTWNAETGREIGVIRLPMDQISDSFAFSPDGTTLALVGFTKRDTTEFKVHLWDTTTGKERIQLEGQEAMIWAIAFSADSKSVAWMGMDSRLVVADAITGRIRHRFQSYDGAGRPEFYTTLAFSRDGKMVAAVGRSAAVHVWDLTTGREILGDDEIHHHAVNDVAYAPDGHTVASASSDSTVRMWDSTTGKHLRKLNGHQGPVGRLVYSADGRRMVSASYENRICIWDAATGKLLHALQAVNPEGYRGVTTLVFTRDAKKLLSFGNDRQLHMWDVATGKEVFNRPIQLKIPPFNAYQRLDAEFSSDGALLALGQTGNIFVVDTQTGLLHAHLKGHEGGGPLHMAFAPDSRTLAIGGGDRTVRLWELASAKELFQVNVNGGVNSVAFAADGRMIAVADGSGWGKGQIDLIDAATGAKLHSFKGHKTFVGGLAFSPNGKLLTSAQLDTILLSWDLAPARRKLAGTKPRR